MWKFALVGIVLMIGTGCETQQRAKTVEPPHGSRSAYR